MIVMILNIKNVDFVNTGIEDSDSVNNEYNNVTKYCRMNQMKFVEDSLRQI